MMDQGKKTVRLVALAAATLMSLGLAAPAAWADDPATLSQPPGPGDPTTMDVLFSVPVSFDDALDEAASYPGDVLAVRYENPEVVGEYSFSSGVTPSAFEADFLTSYGTTPAATALVVATTVPDDDSFAGRAATPTVAIEGPAFVPQPAVFSAEILARFTPPTVAARAASTLAGVTDWRASQAQVEITNYTANRVSFVSSYWWLGPNQPDKVPAGFGVEFEVNMYGNTGNTGNRPWCYTISTPTQLDVAYKSRLAAQNQNWNWQVVRPDGVTQVSTLGAYADYNDLSDECRRGSFGIGLRYPQNIQWVNGAYGVILIIDAPKGSATTSEISANSQVVSDQFCTVPAGSWMSLTDCMGVYPGTWPGSAGPMSQNVLGESRGWTAPRKCWLTDYTTKELGEVYDNTSWQCP